MIQAINAKSDQTGVRANWLGERDWSSRMHRDMKVRTLSLVVRRGGRFDCSGPVAGVYEGSYEISAMGEQAVSNTFSSTTQSLNAEVPSTLR